MESRLHFLNVAAQMMRRVLVDEARKRHAGKRGAGAPRLSLDDAPEPRIEPSNDLLALDSGLLLPLVEACVRDIDLEARRILVAPGFSD